MKWWSGFQDRTTNYFITIILENMALHDIDHTADTIIPPIQINVDSNRTLRSVMEDNFHERYAVSRIFSDTYKTSMFIMFFNAIQRKNFDLNGLELGLKNIALTIASTKNIWGSDWKVLYFEHESNFDSMDLIGAMIQDLDARKQDFISLDPMFLEKYSSISWTNDVNETAEFLFDAMRSLLEIGYLYISKNNLDSTTLVDEIAWNTAELLRL